MPFPIQTLHKAVSVLLLKRVYCFLKFSVMKVHLLIVGVCVLWGGAIAEAKLNNTTIDGPVKETGKEVDYSGAQLWRVKFPDAKTMHKVSQLLKQKLR